jgi:thymidylate synthase ThyX
MKLITEASVRLISRPHTDVDGLTDFLTKETNGTWSVDNDTTDAEDIPEIAGRICYLSFDKPRPGGNEAYLKHIKEVRHGSVLEHSNFSILLTGVSRSLTHELVRHRAGFAFSQLSQRYVDSSDVAFIVPPEMATEVNLAVAYVEKHGGNTVNNVAQGLVPRPDTPTFIGILWLYTNQVAQADYADTVEYLVGRMAEQRKANFVEQIKRMAKMAADVGDSVETFMEKMKASKLIPDRSANESHVIYICNADDGTIWAVPIPPMTQSEKTNIRKAARGTARSVLPNCTETKIMVTANARAWRTGIEQRCSIAAEIEIRRVFGKIWELLVIAAPNLFNDYTKISLPDGTFELITPYTKI